MTAPYYWTQITVISFIIYILVTSYNILSLSLVFFIRRIHFCPFSNIVLHIAGVIYPASRHTFLFDPYIYRLILYTLKRKIRCHVRFPQHIRLPVQIHFYRKMFDVNKQNIFLFHLYGNSHSPNLFY